MVKKKDIKDIAGIVGISGLATLPLLSAGLGATITGSPIGGAIGLIVTIPVIKVALGLLSRQGHEVKKVERIGKNKVKIHVIPKKPKQMKTNTKRKLKKVI